MGRRHQLRDEVDQARHALARRERRYAPRERRARSEGGLRDRILGWRLHDEPAAGRRAERPGVRRLGVRRQATRSRARRAGATRRSRPLLLEERQVGARLTHPGARPTRLLGVARVPQPWRPVARRTLQRRLRRSMASPIEWRIATVNGIHDETLTVRSFTLALSDWPGHRAGQHVPLSLTAEDGYSVERSYSIASEPERTGEVDITVERIPDGEVSPFLHDVVVEGDRLEVRGPIGGYFVWEAALGGPLLLVAGGSGVVPLMAMIRHRQRAGSDVPTRLLFSSRHLEEIIYRDELDRLSAPHNGLEVFHTLTRSQPEGWTGYN